MELNSPTRKHSPGVVVNTSLETNPASSDSLKVRSPKRQNEPRVDMFEYINTVESQDFNTSQPSLDGGDGWDKGSLGVEKTSQLTRDDVGIGNNKDDAQFGEGDFYVDSKDKKHKKNNGGGSNNSFKMVIRNVLVPPLEVDYKHPSVDRPLLPNLTTFLNSRISNSKIKIARNCFYVVWAVVFFVAVYYHRYGTITSLGPPASLDCYSNFYPLDPSQAGVEGSRLEPFGNKSVIVRCFADCKPSRYWFTSKWLGKEYINDFQLVIGSDTYRADSTVCQAAIHAGLSHNMWGGCFKVDFVGGRDEYTGSDRNGISSFSFPSWFPKSYVLSPVEGSFCVDYSWMMLPMQMVFLAVFTLVLQPSKPAFFWTMMIVAYWHCALFSDTIVSDSFVSKAFGTFIPFLAISIFVYRTVAQIVLLGPLYPIDNFVFFVIPLYFGLYINKWSSSLPPFTLTPDLFHDEKKRTIFLIGAVVIFILILYQLYHIRRIRLLPYVLAGYIGFGVLYALLPIIFFLDVHLHHWIFGLIFLPLTRMQMRNCLLYQAILLGVFINGAARWGFDSPLTARTSTRSISDQFSVTGPTPTANWTFTLDSFQQDRTLKWGFYPVAPYEQWVPSSLANASNPITDIDTIPAGMWIHGYSLVMNDVEIYRGRKASYDLRALNTNLHELKEDRPYFFRVAITSEGRTFGYTDPMVVKRLGEVYTVESAELILPQSKTGEKVN